MRKNIIYACSSGIAGIKGLEKLIEMDQIKIVGCLLSEESKDIEAMCEENNICYYYSERVDNLIDRKADMLISFSYSKKIPIDIINAVRFAINIHPAPLPYYKGKGCSFHAIYNNETKWAATAHMMTDVFDDGEIVDIEWFDIETAQLYGYELREKTWDIALVVLDRVLKQYLLTNNIESHPQEKCGKYYSQKDLDDLKRVYRDDKAEEIDRKIRAFWFPSKEGAYIELDGKRYQLIDEKISKIIQTKW